MGHPASEAPGRVLRVYLTGFMGAGKTSVGGTLSKLLGCPSLDLDQAIETRAGLSVREIFERHGEAAFRELEHSCLKETERFEEAVVATGGGTMTFPRNVAVIRRLGISVWLNPSFETLADRIGPHAQQKRPLFTNREEARELFYQRLPAYRQSDLRVDVAPRESSSEVADRIALRLREKRCDI